jgi:hypothetical protein
MKKLGLLFACLSAAPAFAQGAGPGNIPSPWQQAYPDVYYNNGGVRLPYGVPGGSKGAGTLNAAGVYINGVAVSASLPPSLTTLGSVYQYNAVTNQFLTSVDGTGHFASVRPSFGNLSGAATAAQMPAFTGGDCTSSAGSVVLSCAVFGKLATANTWALAQTFTLAPTLTALTGYLYGNGAGAVTASTTVPSAALSGTTAAAQEPAHTGDVTNTAGSLAFTLTGGVAASNLATSAGATRGGTYEYGASGITQITPGAAGTIYTSNGVGSDPSYQASPSLIIYRGFLGGLALSNDLTTPNTIIDISVGQATSSDGSTLMSLLSAYSKTTAAWALGTGNGGLDIGGVLASTWYNVLEIQRIDTNVVDVLLTQAPGLASAVTCTSATPGVCTWGSPLPFQNGAPVILSGTTAPTGLTLGTRYFVVGAAQLAGTFSLAATQGGAAIATTGTGTGLTAASNPVLPTSYTKSRRLGSIVTDVSSNLKAFKQLGDEFLYATGVQDLSAVTVSSTPALYLFSVPIGVKVSVKSRYLGNTTATVNWAFQSPDEASANINTPTGNVTLACFGASTCSAETVTRSGAGQQIRLVGSGGAGLSEYTFGWIDLRGRFD